MNTRLIPISVIAVTVLLVSLACSATIGGGNQVRGSGNIQTESRSVSDFDEIDVCCGMQLELTQGSAENLDIEADDNILPEIVSTVSGGKLTVRYKNELGTARYRPSQVIRVQVSVIEIRAVTISGGGRLETEAIETDRLSIELSGGSQGKTGMIRSDELIVNLSGGSKLTASQLLVGKLSQDLSGGSEAEVDDFQGESLSLEASGGGESHIVGQVKDQSIHLSGGSSLRAEDLQSERAVINMSGGGKATLWATETLDAELSGGAQVDYYGSPVINQRLSGGSELNSRGEK